MGFVIVTMGVWLAVANGAPEENPLEQRAASVAPTDAEELIALGDLYVEAMQLKKAKATYKAAAARMKNSAEAKYGLAKIQMQTGKLQPSKRACRLIARSAPKSSVGEVCSGWVWRTFDRSARAVEEFTKALKKGDVARGQTGLGEVYRLRNANDQAIEAYKEAIDAGAGYVALVGLGLAYEAKGDTVNALATLKEAVDKEPASCLAQFHYGRMLQKGDEAVTHLSTAVAIRPDWAEGYQELGNALLQSGKLVEAEQAFKKAVGVNPNRGVGHLGLGRALFTQKKYEEAKAALTEALALVPNFADATLMLADVEFALGNNHAAVSALERAVDLSPNKLDVYLHTGDMFFKLGRYTRANGYLQQATSIEPASSRAYLLLGDIACKRSLYKQGQDYYSQALAGDLKDISKEDIQNRKRACKSGP